MNKALIGVGILVLTAILASLGLKILILIQILYLAGFFMFWLGLISGINMPTWLRAIIAAILAVASVVLMYLYLISRI